MFKSLLSSSSRFNLRQSVLKLSQKLGSREFSEETAKFASSEIKSVQNDLFYFVDYWESKDQGIPPEKVIRDFEVYLFSNRYSEAIKQILGISVGCLPDKQLEKFSNLLNYFHRTITDCDDDKEKKKIILEFIKSIFSVFKFSQSLEGRSFKFQEKLKQQQQEYWCESFDEETDKKLNKSNIKAFRNDEDDLLSNISDEEALELTASQVISELNEDDDPYIGDIDDEELEEDSNINLEFGISGCPIDSEAFSTAIYVRILGRDMVSIQEERNRISAATRYVAHLIELFSKESFYENNDDFEKNEFLNTLINLKNETTNLLSLIRFVLENINESFELFHIGRTKFDKRGYQTDYDSNDEFLENLNFEEVISMISGAWEDSLDSKKMEKVRILAKKIPELFFEKKDNQVDKVAKEGMEELEEELKKEEYGTAEYPRDIKAYYQAIFYNLMSRQVVLNKQGTPMSKATRSSIQLICDYVTPLNEDKDGAYSSPKFLLLFKEKITNIKTFIIWMDAKIRENLDGLKIGDSEDDFYKTPQDFINDIDPNEIIDLLTIAWENSKDEEMMTKIRLFEKDVKEKWNDSDRSNPKDKNLKKEELKEYKQLFDEGLISEEEYKALKKKALDL